MSNIQKHFKNKLSLHMASGGFVGMSEGEGKYLADANNRLGTLNSAPKPIAQAPQPIVPKYESPMDAAQYTNDPAVLNAAMDKQGPQRYLDYSPAPSFDPRNTPETISQPRGQRRGLAQQPSTEWQAPKPLAPAFANGGFADIRGAGGPKDDEVPFEVGSGKDKIQGRVANGEKLAVIPSEMAQNPEAMAGLAATMEAHTGKKPVGLRQGFEAYTGAVSDAIKPNELRPEFRSAAQTPAVQPAANAGLEVARDGRAVAAQARTAQPQGFYEKMGRLSAAEAPKPLPVAQAAPSAGLASGALGYLGPIAQGVGGAAMLAHAVDSFPSLRGRATAEASNMELAGTPQHAAEVTKALVAQDANWEQRHGKTLTDAQRTQVTPPVQQVAQKPKTTPASGDYNSGYDAKELARAKAAPIMVAEQNPNVLGLRAAGVTGPMMGDETVNGKTGKTGIRTIDTANGKVYAGRDANGQLHVNSGLEKGSLADIDKARDAEFAAKGYGKDAYGNWMTPERIAAKGQLRGLQYENNKFNATSDQITDTAARDAGLRGLAQYDVEEKQKAATAITPYQQQALALQERGQNITLKSHAAMQGNTEAAAAVAAEKAKQEDAAKAAELYFTTNDEKGDKVVNYSALGKFNRWRSSFAQNDPRAKLEQSELYRRFMAEQMIKDMGAGGSKTELPINHKGTRPASLRDVFTMGNGVMLPVGKVEEFDNGAAVRSTSIPKDEYDTRRLLGLDKK